MLLVRQDGGGSAAHSWFFGERICTGADRLPMEKIESPLVGFGGSAERSENVTRR